MELILILAAVLACIVAGVAVVALSARQRRPPLRLDSEHDEHDEDLLLAEVGPSHSPIDRTAEVLEAEVIEGEILEGEVPGQEPERAQRLPRGAGREG